MNNQFFNQMLNPQYVNPDYYHILQQHQYECRQREEVAKVVKAFDDMIKASQKLDVQHQQIAFRACLARFAAEQNWE